MPSIALFFPRPWPGQTMSGRLPYSLMILHAALQDSPYQVHIIDERTTPDLEAAVRALPRDMVCFGISSFTGVQVANGLNVARVLRRVQPDTPIVWGGWHPSGMPAQTAQHPLVDVAVRGQGHAVLRELADTLASGGDLDAVQGITFLRDGQVVHTPSRTSHPSMERLRMPLAAVDVGRYVFRKAYADRSERTLGILTSLGCPYHCGFCAVASVYKRKVQFRDMDIILDEIDWMVENHAINGLTIDDDNFFVSPSRVREFCNTLLQRPYRLAWDAGVSANLLLEHYSDEDLALIRESGCSQLYIGAESGSEEVMRLVGKKATVEHTYQFVRRMGQAGIRASVSSMVGLPGVPESEFDSTLDMILRCRELNPDFDFRTFYYTPYPSTPLYERSKEHGFQEPASLEGWADHTLRRFKAPWVSTSLRRRVKHFVFYFYPLSEAQPPRTEACTALGRVAARVFDLLFGNRLLQALARWRVRRRDFRVPVDAAWVMFGLRIKSRLDAFINHNADIFSDYDR